MDDRLRTESFLLFEPAQGMLEDRPVKHRVTGELRRTYERNLRSETARDGCDLVVVRGNDDPRNALRPLCVLDRICDERLAIDGHDVLARDSLRAAARGDDRDDLAQLLSVTTRKTGTMGMRGAKTADRKRRVASSSTIRFFAIV